MAYDLSGEGADYPPWRGPPARTLIVATQQRSGSTLLGEAIYFGRGLGCPLEYFHRGFRPAFEERWDVTSLDAYIAQLQHRRTDPSGTFSLKLFWRDVLDLANERAPGVFENLRLAPPAQVPTETYRGLYNLLPDFLRSASWILLSRRDAVRQAVSTFVAWKTESWRRLFEDESRPLSAPAYDAVQIRRLLSRVLRSNAHWQRFLESNDLPHVNVVYEDMEEDYAGTVRRLLHSLGCPDAPIAAPRLHKQTNAWSEELCEQFLAEFRGALPL